MNSKAFTLTELLAVIVLLTVLTSIVIFSVGGVLKNSKKNLTKTQISNIEKSAESYYIKEGIGSTAYNLEETEDCVNLSYLIENGYIDDDEIVDFASKNELNGSVEITYRSNQYNYEYNENLCKEKPAICKLASDSIVGAKKRGAKYNCKVAPNKESYTFYLIDNNKDETSDLIMGSNINTNGEIVINNTISDLGLVAWYVSSNSSENNKYGPINAMEYLYNATKDWTNIDPVNYTYNDKETQGGDYGYTSFVSTNGVLTITGSTITTIGTEEQPLRARMPIYSTNSNITEVTGKANASYLYENLFSSSSDGPYGYWTLSSIGSNSSEVYYVDVGGNVTNHYTHFNNQWCHLWYNCGIGVRPVITIPQNSMK